MSEPCDFGTSRDENIRDWIFVGKLDKEVYRKLQLTKDLTLALTIETVRQSEAVNLQGETVGTVNKVTEGHSNYINHPGKQRGGNKQQGQSGKCGKVRNNNEENCPAKKSTCKTCHKHWSLE